MKLNNSTTIWKKPPRRGSIRNLGNIHALRLLIDKPYNSSTIENSNMIHMNENIKITRNSILFKSSTMYYININRLSKGRYSKSSQNTGGSRNGKKSTKNLLAIKTFLTIKQKQLKQKLQQSFENNPRSTSKRKSIIKNPQFIPSRSKQRPVLKDFYSFVNIEKSRGLTTNNKKNIAVKFPVVSRTISQTQNERSNIKDSKSIISSYELEYHPITKGSIVIKTKEGKCINI